MAEKQIHERHRQRIKQKAEKSGLNSFAEHEILELLLTYVIPRKDTNPIAHELVSKFGSLTRAIDARTKDLMQVKGIGLESARFLNFLSQTIQIYLENKRKEDACIVNTTEQCIKYFRENFVIKDIETLHVVCLSKRHNVIKVLNYEGVNDAAIYVDMREIATSIVDKDINAIAVFHTHPNGEVKPTAEDSSATKKIKEICSALGVEFIDHIIFNETSHYSFEKNRQNKKQSILDKVILGFDEDIETKFKATKKK